MENYKLTVEAVNHYQDKACEIIGNDCDKCEAMYWYGDKQWCCFDTVARFVEYTNKYGL